MQAALCVDVAAGVFYNSIRRFVSGGEACDGTRARIGSGSRSRRGREVWSNNGGLRTIRTGLVVAGKHRTFRLAMDHTVGRTPWQASKRLIMEACGGMERFKRGRPLRRIRVVVRQGLSERLLNEKRPGLDLEGRQNGS